MDEMNMINEMINNETMHDYNEGITVSAQCIVEIQGRDFLLVELEAKCGRKEFEKVLVIELSRKAFEFLREKGVKKCELKYSVPTLPHGKYPELKCTFVVGNNAYTIFEVEGKCDCDKLVVVVSPLCDVVC